MNPGARAEREAREQHDVRRRLDVGDRREGDPPDRGQRGHGRHQREQPGRRLRALPPHEARQQGGAEDQHDGRDALTRAPPRRSSAARPPRASARRRRGCARSASRSTSRRRGPRRVGASATTSPLPSRTVRAATATASSASWVASDDRDAVRGERARSARPARPCARVHAARRLVQQHDGRRSPPRTMARARLWRSPPERSRGWRSARWRRLERRRRRRRRCRGGSSRPASAAAARRGPSLHLPARGFVEPGGDPQQRRLPGPVAAQQGDDLARGRPSATHRAAAAARPAAPATRA